MNSPYYDEYLPDILREIIGRSKPEGVTDNSWSGLGRESICYCENCERKFREKTSKPIPRTANWDDQAYRDWIVWSYARRVEIWDLNNRTTKAAGGPDCLWVGMNGGSASSQSRSFRDFKAICDRAEIILLDNQRRNDSGGFQENGDTGKLVHGMLGWNKLMPESMAMYQSGNTNFRLASKPAPEARMWMLDGFAGGIQPWWHHVGASLEDRRAFRTAAPVMKWHKANEEFLVNRQPVASVGVVWSQRNIDFYGRDQAQLVDLPYRGMMQALVRARVPYLSIHARQPRTRRARRLAADPPQPRARCRTNSVPRCAVLSSAAALSSPAASAASTTSGAIRARSSPSRTCSGPTPRAATWALRTLPSEGGPLLPATPTSDLAPERHAVLQGFDETDILPFGGTLEMLRTDSGASVPLTFIPASPVMPPETAWMREPKTNIPALVLSTHKAGGRVAYMPADIDRRFASDNLPDHGNLLANLVRWASGSAIPLRVEGPGLIDCHLYQQPGQDDSAPGQSDQRGHLARAHRRTDSGRPVQSVGTPAERSSRRHGTAARIDGARRRFRG